MAKRKPRDPFDVKLSKEKRTKLALWLCDEIQNALDARAAAERECDYWWMLYEQARTRHRKEGGADLTSYLATQNVDALHARLMKTVNVEPIWNVEGYGLASENAPFVEEYTQWKAEEGKVQSDLDRLGLTSLVEPRGLIEVYEGTEKRRTRKEMWAALELMPGPMDPLTGMPGEPSPLFDEQGNPKLQMGEDGRYIDTQGNENAPAARVTVDSWEAVRTGPQQRVISYRDSLILPGHARHKCEIWGYGKRIFKRLGELRESPIYDQDQIERLSNVSDREDDTAQQRSGTTVAHQENDTVEKELWELTILKDCDGTGERWYVATVNLGNQVLLRLQYDDLDRARYVPVILFPRPDRATEGFSFVGHKLITTIEEHTAWRNMLADRAAMQAQVPVKKLRGALWDEYEQPFGAGVVITVGDMREVEPMQVQDVTAPIVNRELTMERTAERLAGVNDIAAGQTIQQGDKTLGEVQMATEQSFVRMDLVIRRFQEAMEDLAQIRHAILKRALAENPDGEEVPESVMVGLEARTGSTIEGGRITARMLEGQFRFKPRGSVETADPRALRMDFNQMLQAFPALIQTFPMLGPILLNNPNAARAMLEQFVRIYRIPNRQAFVGAASLALQQPQMGMGGPMGGGMPGMMPQGPGGMPMAAGPTQVQ